MEKLSQEQPIPEHMQPLLEYFDEAITAEISLIFTSPEQYWDAMNDYRAGRPNEQIGQLIELRNQQEQVE